MALPIEKRDDQLVLPPAPTRLWRVLAMASSTCWPANPAADNPELAEFIREWRPAR